MDREVFCKAGGDPENHSFHNNVTIRQGSLEFPVISASTFRPLKLHRDLLASLVAANITAPYGIQKVVFPFLYFHKQENLVIHSPGRSGKSTAAIIKALDVVTQPDDRKCQVLLVYPTRDIAKRTCEHAKELARLCGYVTFHLAIRDNRIEPNCKVTERFIAGTPAKITEYVCRKHIDPWNVKLVVLDEVDSGISKHGYQATLSKFFSYLLPSVHTIVLTGCNNSDETEKFVQKFLRFPVFLKFFQAIRGKTTATSLYVRCSSFAEKITALKHLLKVRATGQTVIVCCSRDSVIDVNDELKALKPVGIHGRLREANRQLLLDEFKDGKRMVLVTTPAYADSVTFCSRTGGTLVNYDTQLVNGNLNYELYHKRAAILDGMQEGLCINMVDDRWSDYVTDEWGNKLKLEDPRTLVTVLQNL